MDRVLAFNTALTTALLTHVLKHGMTSLCGLGVTLTITRRDLGWKVDYKQTSEGEQLSPEEQLLQAVSVVWDEQCNDIMTDTIGQFLPDSVVMHVFTELAQAPNVTPERFRLLAYRSAIRHIRYHETPTRPLLGGS